MSKVNKDQLKILTNLYDNGPQYVGHVLPGAGHSRLWNAIRALLNEGYIVHTKSDPLSPVKITPSGRSAMRDAL